MKKRIILSQLIILLIAGLSLQAQKKAIDLKEFKSADIGNPALTGSTNITEKKITITAGGVDVWNTRDEFRFAYIEKSGDFDLVARIESLTDPHLYTKAGLMAREELSDDSRHIFFQVFPNNNSRNKNNGGYEFQYRKEKAGEMKAIYPASFTGNPEFPVNFPNTWIRLKREGSNFTGYYSSDGTSWKKYTTFPMDISQRVFLGPAVTSHNPGKPAIAVFSNISWFRE
jgi:regulation of enolase protein 1 (concanavalin A-like superfamily)